MTTCQRRATINPCSTHIPDPDTHTPAFWDSEFIAASMQHNRWHFPWAGHPCLSIRAAWCELKGLNKLCVDNWFVQHLTIRAGCGLAFLSFYEASLSLLLESVNRHSILKGIWLNKFRKWENYIPHLESGVHEHCKLRSLNTKPSEHRLGHTGAENKQWVQSQKKRTDSHVLPATMQM
jgi:hypothetical protein